MSDEDKTQGKIEQTDQSKAIALFQFIRELNKLKQKAIINTKDSERETELLKRIKIRASSILNANSPEQSELDLNTIASALNPKSILHSDQGSQFASREFISFCADNDITQSMSRAGNPYDNAPMERFYNTLKTEFVYQYTFETDEDLNQGINEYIFDWYNHRRPHAYNGSKTPFEARHSN